MPTKWDMFRYGVMVPGWLVAWQGGGDLPQLRAELTGFAPLSTAPWVFKQCFPILSPTRQQNGSLLPYLGITDLGPSIACRLCIRRAHPFPKCTHSPCS